MQLLLLFLLFTLCMGAAQKSRRRSTAWNYRAEAEKENTRGCANLTLLLDNWKFAIMTQTKKMLLNDHSTVLPDYASPASPPSDTSSNVCETSNLGGRHRWDSNMGHSDCGIGPLSEAYGDLHKEFNSLKQQLGELTAKFGRVESSVEKVSSGRRTRPRAKGKRAETSELGRKNRVVIRRIKKVKSP